MTTQDHEETPSSSMRRFDSSGDYYALTLTANRRDGITVSYQTQWVGWSKRREGWEIRQASLVNPTMVTYAWTAIGHEWVAVHDLGQLAIFFQLGGHAIVEKTCMERWLPELLQPGECVHDGASQAGGTGFLSTAHLPDDAATRRAPTRKLRMQVLTRDGYRCVICGRSPKNNVDIELEVHHVIPWHMGCPTAEEHLATLCGTCHDGLDPHYEPKIRELAGLPAPAQPGLRSQEFFEEVRRYRSLASTRSEETAQDH